MSDEEKCVCGHMYSAHNVSFAPWNCAATDCRCDGFHPAEETPACTVYPQQCDAECQARSDRKCATETDPNTFEALIDRARRAISQSNINVDHFVIYDALDAGLKAKRECEEAEKRAKTSWFESDYWCKNARRTELELENVKRKLNKTRALLQWVNGPLDAKPSPGTVYERARKALKRIAIDAMDQSETATIEDEAAVDFGLIDSALNLGEAAEKRAESAERERDALRARVAECEALLERCSPKMDPPTDR